MSYSLWLEGVRIGNVDVGAADASGELFGVLEPTPAYAPARPLLQRATLGLAALANLTGLAIHQHLVSVMQDLQSKGLTLRDERGVDVVAQFLLVGDYLPADLDVAIFGSHPPIHVFAQLAGFDVATRPVEM